MKNFRIFFLSIFLSFPFFVIAQSDSIFIFTNNHIESFNLFEIDTISIQNGTTHELDSLVIWFQNYPSKKYEIIGIDSITFNNQFQYLTYNNCPNYQTITDMRDQNIYHTVKIGNQCWLKENLRYLPFVYQNIDESLQLPMYYVYDYIGNSVNLAIQSPNFFQKGVLYNYVAAINSCPKGWHLPDENDWNSLKMYIINHGYNFDNTLQDNKISKSLVCGLPIQLGGLWSNSQIIGAPGNIDYPIKRNLTRFSAFPAGIRTSNGFEDKNNLAGFWSNGNTLTANEKTKFIKFNQVELINYDLPKQYGLSVRCILDPFKIITKNASNIRKHSAELNREFFNAMETIVEQGFYYKKSSDTSYTQVLLFSDTSTIQINNLEGLTQYHFFAFVTTNNFTIYGDTLSFTTLHYNGCSNAQTFIDSRDTQMYTTTQIGSQCWMRENLRYLPVLSSVNASSSTKNYHVYGYSGNDINAAKQTMNYQTHGVLYNWYSATDSIMTGNNSIPGGLKGICPDGWHLPSSNEWNLLINYIGGNWNGSDLKSTTGWTSGTDLYDFKALPSGTFFPGLGFSEINQYGSFQSSTKNTQNYNYNYNDFLRLSNYNSFVALYYEIHGEGMSVRCIKNKLLLQVDSIKNITYSSAELYGTIAIDTGTIISSGFQWRPVGNQNWSFWESANINAVCTITSLDANTIYEVKCFIITPYSQYYGNTQQFITLNSPPTIDKPIVNYTNNNSAIIQCVVHPGTFPIQENGFMYKEMDNGQWNKLVEANYNMLDTLISLNSGKGFDLRGYAIITNDTIYSDTTYFTTSRNGACPGFNTVFDPRDSNVYNTVHIGNQCWMKENIRFLPSINIPSTSSSSIPYYYVYGYNGTSVYDAKNTPEYQNSGVLYNGKAALTSPQGSNQSQGICPEGWQIPTLGDFTALQNYLSANDYKYAPNAPNNAIALSLTGTPPISQGGLWANSEFYIEGVPGCTSHPENRNISGLGLNPTGDIQGGSSIGYNNIAAFWTLTRNSVNPYIAGISYIGTSISSTESSFTCGHAVRCIKYKNPQFYIYNPSLLTISSSIIRARIVPGYDTIIQHGFKWKLLNDSIWNEVLFFVDSMELNLSNLSSASTYQYKLFANTLDDSLESSIMQFTTFGFNACPEMPILNDSRDFKSYTTIKIGNNCWMKENLRYMPFVSSPSTYSFTDSIYYVYGYNGTDLDSALLSSNYQHFGVLYNAKASYTACPDGWHLPFEADWDTLKKVVISLGYNYNGSYTANKIAKALVGSNPQSIGGFWSNSSLVGVPGNIDYNYIRNSTNFNILPSGYLDTLSGFTDINNCSYFWTNHFPQITTKTTRKISFDADSLMKSTFHKANGLSIRCVKDIQSTIQFSTIFMDTNRTSIKQTITYGNDSLINGVNFFYRHIDSTNWISSYTILNVNIQLQNLATYKDYLFYGFIISSTDTIFSDTLMFRTLQTRPKLNFYVDDMTNNSFQVHSTFKQGTLPIIENGFCYQHIDSTNWITIPCNCDTINYLVSNLTQHTQYRIKGYVSDSLGFYYSTVMTVSTNWNAPCVNNEFVTDNRDGNVYRTVQIGNQCWMRENLRYLPSVTPPNIFSSTIPYCYVYGFVDTTTTIAKTTFNYNTYGVLYNYSAAMNNNLSQPIEMGICPTGWHIPSQFEMETLVNYLQNNGYNVTTQYNNVDILLSMVGSLPIANNGLWTNYGYPLAPGNIGYLEKRNISGFSILPAGYRSYNSFSEINQRVQIWTSTSLTTGISKVGLAFYNNASFSLSNRDKSDGASVRCIKN